MTVQLDRSHFQQLARIVQELPEFANVRDRRQLVAGALEGVDRGDTILARLDLDGTPMGVAVEVVRFLAQFGQVAYGKEALGVFLNYIQPFVGDEDAAFIAGLFRAYPLDAPVAPGRPITRWRGTDSPAEVQEKIIGENTLRPIYMLELALEAAKAVAHLRIPKEDGETALGTGFMVARDLVMTNHHVIATPGEAAGTEISFNYQLDRHGVLCQPAPARALVGGLFYTNGGLDFTVAQLDSPPRLRRLDLAARAGAQRSACRDHPAPRRPPEANLDAEQLRRLRRQPRGAVHHQHPARLLRLAGLRRGLRGCRHPSQRRYVAGAGHRPALPDQCRHVHDRRVGRPEGQRPRDLCPAGCLTPDSSHPWP